MRGSRFALLTALLVFAMGLAVTLAMTLAAVGQRGDNLQSVAADAAARIDARAHRSVTLPMHADGAAFLQLRTSLRQVREQYEIDAELYTLRKVSDDETAFVVMTNATPFVGDRYELRSEMRPVFDLGERATTGLYRSSDAWWVSAYAPIGEPPVESLVEVDRESGDLVRMAARGAMVSAAAAFVAGLLALMLPTLREAGPVRGVTRFFGSSLAVRIGASGSLAVIAAVGVMGWLQHRQARAELIDQLTTQLVTAVSVGAPRVDAAAHVEIARTRDATSRAFTSTRRTLRELKEQAGLTSEVYTFHRDGELVRFVAMTNETPFVGDTYELRGFLRTVLETGVPASEGPYTDAHHTWISAAAPIVDDTGQVVGALQADHEIGELLDELANRALRSLMFALAGIAASFGAAAWTARSIAGPIGRVARAAGSIGAGDLDTQVPEDRDDEVGKLQRAINTMAVGLRERDQIRSAFGKYIAQEVVQELLASGELSMDGELREVTVMESDIRGYTPLTESLGAEEVVKLLNDYFAMLVEEVVRHGGHIDKFMGDAMLCWFGAPIRHEDHRERAMQTGQRILQRLAEWNAERATQGLPPVHTGIGIAVGSVVVGNIGSPEHKIEYTAIGEAVNLAARLCSKAEHDELLVSHAVYEAAPDDRFVRVGPISVKGVSEPVLVYKFTVED